MFATLRAVRKCSDESEATAMMSSRRPHSHPGPAHRSTVRLHFAVLRPCEAEPTGLLTDDTLTPPIGRRLLRLEAECGANHVFLRGDVRLRPHLVGQVCDDPTLRHHNDAIGEVEDL